MSKKKVVKYVTKQERKKARNRVLAGAVAFLLVAAMILPLIFG